MGLKWVPDVSKIGGEINSTILTKHDYRHHRVGTCSSSADPSRRPREPSKASSWSLRYNMQPPRRVRGGALEAPRSLLEDTLREDFAGPSRRLREGWLIHLIMTSPPKCLQNNNTSFLYLKKILI